MIIDPIPILNAAYANVGNRDAWFRGVLDSVQGIERGFGLLAYSFEFKTMQPTGFIGTGEHVELLSDFIRGAASQAESRDSVKSVDPIGLYSSRDVFGDDAVYPLGGVDGYALSFVDGERMVHVITSLASERLSVSRETAEVWRYLSLHLGAGSRLHRHGGHIDDAEVEAIFEDGKVKHATGGALSDDDLEALRDAAVRIDRVRGGDAPSDAREALALWPGLILGRYSLVDHFERNGRRYIVARRNDPDSPSPPQLSRREKQVAFYSSLGLSLKHIGYTLGLHENTVASHQAAVLSKLGLENRTQLIELASRLS